MNKENSNSGKSQSAFSKKLLHAWSDGRVRTIVGFSVAFSAMILFTMLFGRLFAV